MADFSQLMAQMIAQARPQQAPGQTHPAVVGGGGLGLKGKETQTKVGVDVGGAVGGAVSLYNRLTGKLPPQTRDELIKEATAAHETFNVLYSMDPERAKSTSVANQLNLEKWQKAGYGQIVEDPSMPPSPLGRRFYTFIPGPPDPVKWKASMTALMVKPGTPEAKREVTRPPSREEIEAGMAGEEPRAGYVKTHAEIARAQAAAPPHESLINLRAAEQKMHEDQAALLREQTRLAPDELVMKQTQAAAQNRYHNSLANKADTDAAESVAIAKSGLTKPAMQGLRDNDIQFNKSYDAWNIKNSMLPDDEISNYRKIAEMEGLIFDHISGSKFYSGKGLASEGPIRRWFSLVDREFERSAISEKAGILGIKGAITGEVSQATVDQQARRRYYLKKGIEMLKEADFISVDGLINRSNPSSMALAKKVVGWARAAGLSDAEIDYLFQKGTLPTVRK